MAIFDWADTIVHTNGADGQFEINKQDYSDRRDQGGNSIGDQTVANNTDNFIGLYFLVISHALISVILC